MAFKNAQVTRCYFAGLALHAYTRDIAPSWSSNMLDVTTHADTSKQMIPGSTTGEWSTSGPVDDVNPVTRWTVVKASTTVLPVTVPILGTDVAQSVWMFGIRESSIDTTSSQDGLVEWTGTGQVTGEVDFNGTVLENNTTVTADTDGTIVDHGAATSNGAVFHLHVTAYSGFTSDVITVEGSTNGSWAGEETTVATFTTQTAATFAFAPYDIQTVTGTVPRYLRVVDNVTGTGSISRFVAVARR